MGQDAKAKNGDYNQQECIEGFNKIFLNAVIDTEIFKKN